MNVPRLTMLARQVRNFVGGQTAYITLVYHAPEPVTVRWFRPGGDYLLYSELPKKLPVNGKANL